MESLLVKQDIVFRLEFIRLNGGVLKPGENEILIRLECRDGKGRITPDKPFGLYFQTGEVIRSTREMGIPG